MPTKQKGHEYLFDVILIALYCLSNITCSSTDVLTDTHIVDLLNLFHFLLCDYKRHCNISEWTAMHLIHEHVHKRGA